MSDRIASALARLPLTFRELGNRSIVSLLEEIDGWEAASQASLCEALKAEPALVEEWARYSEDKRTSEGWFLIDRGNFWEVGYLAQPRSGAKLLRFKDPHEACAMFAFNELESIRSRMIRRP